MKYPLICLFLACTLTGCAGLHARHAQPAPLAAPDDALLNYATSLRTRNAAELADEAEALAKTHSAQRSEETRLRLAVFHAVAPQPFGDRMRALSLLDVAPGEANGRGRQHPVAQMLLPLLHELRRVDELHNRLREEQKRSEMLQQKLDAMRDIERKMLERMPSEKPR